MYIEPNTSIKILSGCPLNNKYEHTIFFPNELSQRLYFQSLTKYTLEKQSYQRIQRGKMRVAVKAEDLYDCNYLMFQNTSFGSRWFYAFIKSVEYVNNVTSEIEFEIDVMQTWLFDCELQSCYVERNHVLNDTPYKWLAPEPFSVNRYKLNPGDVWTGYAQDIFHDAVTEPQITVVYTSKYNNDGDTIIGEEPGMYAGVYSGLSYISVPSSEHAKVTEFIHALDAAGHSDGIVGIYMTPLPVLHNARFKDITLPINPMRNDFGDGYTIRNKKLLQYPYIRIALKTTDGVETELKPELLTDGQISARIYFIPSLPPSMVLVPRYSGIFPNFDYSVQYTENPQCAWSSDMYANWKATEGITNSFNKYLGIVNAGGSVVNSILGSFGSPTRGLRGGVESASTIASAGMPWVNELRAQNLPGKQGGIVNSGSFNYATGRIGFEVWCYRVDASEAKMFDDYLDKYGYAINEIRVPNISGRPHWCYVKTREASLKGSVPTDDMVKIKNIYDNGITFWKHGDEVGDYSLDNTINN